MTASTAAAHFDGSLLRAILPAPRFAGTQGVVPETSKDNTPEKNRHRCDVDDEAARSGASDKGVKDMHMRLMASSRGCFALSDRDIVSPADRAAASPDADRSQAR
jgi:hypothetical protein